MTAPATPAAGRSRESGFSILLVLALALLLSTLAMVTAQRMMDLSRDGRRGRDSAAVLYAAEGGVEAARAALVRDPAWAGGSVDVDGIGVRVTVERLSAEPAAFRVAAVAVGRGASRRVEAVLLARGTALPSLASWKE